MYELTIGDQRYVEESLTIWRMYINPIINSLNEAPSKLTDRLRELESQYIEEFYAFYKEKKEENENLHADAIHNAFDDVWSEKHPDFYDMDKLFEGLSDEDMKRAEKAINKAKEAFEQ